MELTLCHVLAYAEKAEAEKSEAAFRFNCAQRKLLCNHVFPKKSTRHPQVPMRIPSRMFRISSQCQSSGLNGPSHVGLHLSHRRGLIWGLKQPVYSAIALEIWVLSRVWYTVGYIKKGPNGVRTPDQHEPDLVTYVLSFPLVLEVGWCKAQRDCYAR